MKTIISSVFTVLILFINGIISAQSANKEMQIIEMLKCFYTEYNAFWSTKPPLALYVLEWKLDSLNAKYCTKKLRKDAKKSLEGDYGFDLITNGFPGIDLFEGLDVKKESKVENKYIVSYSHTFNDIPNKPVKQKVKLHVSVVKEEGSYKINEVK